MTVLVETTSAQGYIGRCYADAPEIDGVVNITTDTKLALGEFCQVRITAADEYDLYASLSR
jgi:ribosomal protein S12 methylthiotransferase